MAGTRSLRRWRRRGRTGCAWALVLFSLFFCAWPDPLRADPIFYPGEEIAAQDLVETMKDQDVGSGWVGKWRRMTIETRERQPHYLTPLVTETPRLEQRIRYDIRDETLANGKKRWDFGQQRGVNIIIAPTLEVAASLPDYLYYPGAGQKDGFVGERFIIKNRIMASPENQKNYVFSVALHATTPTGTVGVVSGVPQHWIWTPYVLFGKGWGNFDFMINLGTSWADGDNKQLGSPIIWNVALQYRFGVICPTIEINSHPSLASFYVFGQPGLFVTPEVLIGRFHFQDYWSVYFGFGYQMALNSATIEAQYANAFIMKFHLLF